MVHIILHLGFADDYERCAPQRRDRVAHGRGLSKYRSTVTSDPNRNKLSAARRRVLVQCGISFIALAAAQRLTSILWPSHGSATGWPVPVAIFGSVFFTTRWMMNMSHRINDAGETEPNTETAESRTQGGASTSTST